MPMTHYVFGTGRVTSWAAKKNHVGTLHFHGHAARTRLEIVVCMWFNSSRTAKARNKRLVHGVEQSTANILKSKTNKKRHLTR